MAPKNEGFTDDPAIQRLIAECLSPIHYTTVETPDHTVTFIVSPCIFVHLVLSPTYALIYIIKILSQAVTLLALYTPTCFDPYGSSSGSTAGPC